MGSILAAVVMLSLFAAALGAVLAVRRRPLALAAPIALALVVVFEALLLDGLSLPGAVAWPGLLAGHLVAVGAAAAIAWARGARPADANAVLRRGVREVRRLGWPGLLLVPVLALLVASAVRYLPNNWDSMTYHLARVAHWLQHRSVEPYPTSIDRQVVYQPGAEYVLAALQGISGSDRLANLLQLCAWVLVALALAALARVAGAPRRVAPWAAVVFAALPMGVLEASSTQNDLVAGCLALAIVSAALPFMHRERRGRPADAILLGLAIAGGALVKATALVAAAPFLAFALARLVATSRARPRDGVVAVALAAAVALVPVAPEIVRRTRPELAEALARHAQTYTYRGLEAIPDRLLNLGRGVVRHVPSPPSVVAAVGIEGWCQRGEELCQNLLLRPHEDNAGNPLHVVLVLLAGALALARSRRLPARAALVLGAVPAAWVLFHLVFRDNTWISRLETPTYVLAGLGVVAWAARPRPAPLAGKRGRRPAAPAPSALPTIATATAATLALAFGARVALANETRPPLPRAGQPELLGYYVNQPNMGRVHDAVLRAAETLRCPRIGLYIGGDSYDYPLTWRAMERGWEVRHVSGKADPWPCLVFSDLRPAPAKIAELGWTRTSLPFVFLNGPGGAPPAPAVAGGR